MLALDALAIDVDGLAVEDVRPAMDHLHAMLFQQGGNAAGQPIDNTVFPGHALADVQGRRRNVDAQIRLLTVQVGLVELLGDMDQRL
ncbi:hypothetical protein D3C80_838950 [compost metagenome]